MTDFPTMHVLWVPGAQSERDANVDRLMHEAAGRIHAHSDPDRNGVLWNYRNALRCARQDKTTWSVIVQDDAIPIDGWQTHLVQALHFAPTGTVGLGHCGGYGKRLAERGIPYGTSAAATWGFAIGYHRSVLPMLLEIVEHAVSIGWNPKSDDGTVIAYNLLSGSKSSMAARSIFDHRTDLKSLLGHGGSKRYPQWTIRESGPWWGSTPRSAPLSLSSSSPDVLELVASWRRREQ